MAWSVDARIPVRLGHPASAGPDDAILLEAGLSPPSCGVVERFEPSPPLHAAGCACCGGRSATSVALDRLFQRRVRGEVPFFRRVLAVTETPEGDMAVWTALRTDPVAAARFRLEDDSMT